MFQINEMTEVRLATFTKREETHGDEKVPAVSIAVELTGANTLLDSIDAEIRLALYKPVDDQDQLPGVEVATPVLRCNSFDKHTLTAAHEGWTLCVDDGIDDTTPMTFGGCKVDRLQVEAKQGGSVVLRFRIGTSDLDADRLGKLGMLHGHSMWITLKAPEKKPDAIDGSVEAFEADHPGAGEGDATDLFSQTSGEAGAAAQDGDGTGNESRAMTHQEFGAAAAAEIARIEAERPNLESKRTARGREATQKALDQGMAAAGELQ